MKIETHEQHMEYNGMLKRTRLTYTAIGMMRMHGVRKPLVLATVMRGQTIVMDGGLVKSKQNKVEIIYKKDGKGSIVIISVKKRK